MFLFFAIAPYILALFKNKVNNMSVKKKIPEIHVLPENLANKIAAGEVVERPASVVKELIENAIDAGATHIVVAIEQAGKELIHVKDNGIGMNAEDIPLAFERHATSKIRSERDLEEIETLGFRGEALPSIASVSQVEVKARRADESMGSIFTLNGGKDAKLRKTAANVGTSIRIKNIFFNTPARRQFLRSDTAEYQQILTVLKRFFLGYPDIQFEFWSNSKRIFHLPESELGERVQSILGGTIFKGLLPLNTSLAGIELSGFISRPDVVRKSRGHQFLFLNGRPIQSKSLQHAIFQGYSNLIAPGEYPVYCLYLEMDPGLADVNVHPTKMDVRFTNDRSVYYFFINSVQQVLKDENVVPEFLTSPSGSAIQPPAEERPREIISEMQSRKRNMARYSGSQLSLTYFDAPEPKKQKMDAPTTDLFSPIPGSEPIPAETAREQVQFWQIHNRYILSEIKSGMVLIDQHVAHERILFERITRILKEDKNVYGQKLLFPQKLNLNFEDFEVLKNIHDVLNKMGFSIKIFSGTTIVIEAMPTDVKVGRESQILLDIIDYYKNEPLKDFDHAEKIAAAYSCKNAIKSGEKLSQMEMHNLVDQLFACESPFFCPHGRPVVITIDLEELDRKFKRIP